MTNSSLVTDYCSIIWRFDHTNKKCTARWPLCYAVIPDN